VRARASVVLFEVPSSLARSLSERPAAGPSATASTSRNARATLRTVYRPATGSPDAGSSAETNGCLSFGITNHVAALLPVDHG